MSVILRNIQIPLFIKIETGCLRNIRKILDEQHIHFQKPLIISEKHILEMGGNDVVHALNDPATILTNENSLARAKEIIREIREKRNDVLVNIGGGRVLDLGKYIATKAGVNYISIPTSPSNDGISSPVAVLINEEGLTESIPVNMPVGILVDTKMLTSAPIENIRSGVGDLISNMSAIADWRLAYAAGKESMDDFAASIAYSAAQLIYETCRGGKMDLQEETFLQKLVHGLILSGIAMNIAGSSRPCSGSEHKISHAIDLLYPKTSMHGLQVAYGMLLTGMMRGESIEHLIDFFKSVHLPLTHTALGLTDEQMVEVLLRAPETRSERYTIFEQLNLDRKKAIACIEQYNIFISKYV
ncbi:MAG: iron-containing alcohol dehydrogenase family protein [Candidatus Kerfeldbacteria bacterium]|nr:iron-containing alcohol dehydrogenase family protein [Candidatus Kerfeldbacteria bacterium]